jgi:hypothetical protein
MNLNNLINSGDKVTYNNDGKIIIIDGKEWYTTVIYNLDGTMHSMDHGRKSGLKIE